MAPDSPLHTLSVDQYADIVGKRSLVRLLPGSLLNPDAVADKLVPGAGQALVGLSLGPAQRPALQFDAGDVVQILYSPGNQEAAASSPPPPVLGTVSEHAGRSRREPAHRQRHRRRLVRSQGGDLGERGPGHDRPLAGGRSLMAVLAFASAKALRASRRPVLALTFAWHRPALVVEADMSGSSSVLSGLLRGGTHHSHGLVGLSVAARQHGFTDQGLWDQCVRLGEERYLLPGIASPRRRRRSRRPGARSGVLADLEAAGLDVLVDAGRLGTAYAPCRCCAPQTPWCSSPAPGSPTSTR